MTVAILKDLCRQRGLKVSGNKADLIARLEGASPQGLAADNGIPEAPASVQYLQDSTAAARATSFARMLQKALQNPKFLPKGGLLGLPCFHLYEREQDLPSTPQLGPHTRAADLRLRGADALFAVAAARLGLSVSIMRLLYVDDGGDGQWKSMETLPTLQTTRGLSKLELIEDEVIERGISTEGMEMDDGDREIDDVTWLLSLPHGVSGAINENGMIPQAPLLEAYVSSSGYFGNEAGEGCVYAQCAVILDIPAADSAARSRAASAPLPPPEAFAHTRAGLPADVEVKQAEQRLEAFEKKHPTASKEELVELAKRMGVGSSGSAAQIAKRICTAAERGRMLMYGATDDFGFGFF